MDAKREADVLYSLDSTVFFVVVFLPSLIEKNVQTTEVCIKLH